MALRFYNKLDGLHELKTLAPLAGNAEVAPFIVLLPRDAVPETLRSRAPRFVLRSNLDGHLSPEAWRALPRRDWFSSGRESLESALESMKRAWVERADGLDSRWEHDLRERPVHLGTLHFIIHPVERRSHYPLSGCLRIQFLNSGTRTTLHLGKTHELKENWRDNEFEDYELTKGGWVPWDARGASGRGALPPEKMLEIATTAAHSQALVQSLQRMTRLLHERTKEYGMKPGEALETSFTVAKNAPVVTYYDLLRTESTA